MAALRAGRAGMSALQIFTAIPKYYGDRASIRPERVTRFRAALKQTGIAPEHVMAHAAYVLNTATADEEKWERAAAGLSKELERSTALGIGSVCFHPGAATGGTREAGLSRVARAMVRALKTVQGPTRLLIENTAGAGLTLGRTADEVAAVLSAIPPALRGRIGYGLDTCHLFCAGYQIARSEKTLRSVLDEFERATGARPSFFHLNDSAFPFGSNRDRHALIGEGNIGVDAFRWLLRDARAQDLPLILETPQERLDIAADDPTPDPYDVRMMELLRALG